MRERDPDFDGLSPFSNDPERANRFLDLQERMRQQEEQDEHQRYLTDVLEECRVSIGGKRGDKLVALLYHELHLTNPREGIT